MWQDALEIENKTFYFSKILLFTFRLPGEIKTYLEYQIHSIKSCF